MLYRIIRHVVIVVLLLGLCGCPPKPLPSAVVEIDQHIDRLLKGVPYTPHANGYWLSDDALDELIQQLKDLQYQLDSMPKASSERIDPSDRAEVDLDSDAGMPIG